MKIRLLLVDDHAVVRMGLRMLLEVESDFEIAGEAETASDAINQVAHLKPDVVLMDIGLPDLSGRAIRGYELGRRIGTGGFGVVYRANQPLIEREVAIKIFLPQYADHPDFIRRFEAEAQLVARRRLQDFDFIHCGMVLREDGMAKATGAGAASLGNPIEAVRWLAERAAGSERPLQAGDVVLSGALGPMMVVRPGRHYSASIAGLESVSVSFAGARA